MNIIENPTRKDWKVLTQRPSMNDAIIQEKVSNILQEVKEKGDKALLKFAKDFDNFEGEIFEVGKEEIKTSGEKISLELRSALQMAYYNIYKFHEAQKPKEIEVRIQFGVRCWQRASAIEKVGFYIPGGTAPLFSTVLMLGVPAQIANCQEIILCTPAQKEIHPAILYAANLVGVHKIYRVGGAQAIAAMGYGTESIPQVDKIFGPGNQYVTTAKMLMAKEGMAIDMPAGPSELLVMADETCIPEFVAADLLSQAEHGEDSQVVLLAKNKEIATKVIKEIKKQLENLPKKNIAEKSLENSRYIIFDNLKEMIDFSNFYAPEHLIIASESYEGISRKITNAGSVFLGNFAPESAGDYASGTNHTLPTNAFAKAYSGVSLDSFLKKITFQHISQEGISVLGKTISIMAEAESLEAHKKAVDIRLTHIISEILKN